MRCGFPGVLYLIEMPPLLRERSQENDTNLVSLLHAYGPLSAKCNHGKACGHFFVILLVPKSLGGCAVSSASLFLGSFSVSSSVVIPCYYYPHL